MADEQESQPTRITCGFYVKRKNRYCKMIVGKGKKYCGEHMHLSGENGDNRKRILCPLDPKHSVYEDQLKNHLKRCNVKKKTDVVYYAKNINSGIVDYKPSSEEKIPLSSFPQDCISKVIHKLKKFFKDNNLEVMPHIMSHDAFKAEMSQENYGPSVHKHLKQQASLVGNMERLGLLQPDTVYLEFGAGKGKLSHWVQQAHPEGGNVEYVLIDRASNRYKFDSCHKRGDNGPDFKRVLLDIEHLNLGELPHLGDKTRRIVAVSKHLCGTATGRYLTLRCLLDTLHGSSATEPDSTLKSEQKDAKRRKLDAAGPSVIGIVVALCCHHQCYWPHYVGRPFLESLGITPQEFHLLCCMSSWATCGMRPPQGSSKEAEHCNTDESGETDDDNGVDGSDKGLGLSIADREEIGRQCKRLLDAGRVWYLREKGFNTSLAYYVDSSVSLENVVLLATANT
ncbi:predicted protein [Nematostella vectensis]|uniref:tRNA:m(4)X modification enzyme TRM13 n=1 Tax=Nematostella vectensis TaxID=45351 RepID=A7RR85_NEMVE|nr:predicted protein [Nematostella vectensis]|eukprot:XP_001638186.1 predicted protein [Nematostella vectensis]